ncbi:MAG TPA: hypothetical protein PLS49_09665 [Candidatus Woesebacteria bacterium]|nr:hypothetical protein [Candidatus Woesebacteria bacterium]
MEEIINTKQSPQPLLHFIIPNPRDIIMTYFLHVKLWLIIVLNWGENMLDLMMLEHLLGQMSTIS